MIIHHSVGDLLWEVPIDTWSYHCIWQSLWKSCRTSPYIWHVQRVAGCVNGNWLWWKTLDRLFFLLWGTTQALNGLSCLTCNICSDFQSQYSVSHWPRNLSFIHADYSIQRVAAAIGQYKCSQGQRGQSCSSKCCKCIEEIAKLLALSFI